MGEGDWFSQFCTGLRISREKRGNIAYRAARIVNQLETDFRSLVTGSSANRFYVGSYGRNTAIPSVSDVDLLYELPAHIYTRFNNYAGNGQSALLAAVKNSIRKTYKVSDMAGDGQVVVISFTDGVRFEILPAFLNTAGGYTFADANGGGSWKSCKPKQEMSAFGQRNAECNGNLVELCRMARAWRDHNNVDMSGMLIDTLAYQFIAGWQYRQASYVYFDYLTRDFFHFLANIPTTQLYWQAPGSGSFVFRGLPFQSKARSAELRALEAIRYQLDSYNWSARQKYREIYGNAFPA
ncbi:SMODS domain-containing nucleotidyltransferase [Cupriavidus taiwanensis]|uniref:SMODS domain-containing nucleotidyltransferase n=1 Tax=Cupriavidus taiwanensis TaxID=164546 RepID=UPI000E10D416|nr:nucleotidyltransferase domain-containing protein [Cupriavidus taiwanensis]SPA56696.1 conserved protein of unknown function [Cupriavidus taiwanensis]